MLQPDRPDIEQIKAALLDIISEILGEPLPPIPDETPILDFVLSSLTLVEGMRRIYEHFGVLVSIRRVIEGQATLGGIAAYIEQELQTQGPRRVAAFDETAIEDEAGARRLAFAPSQEHIGFLFRYSPESSAAYNESLAVRLTGPLDAPALQSAVDAVVNRYEALRTSLDPNVDELLVHTGHPQEVNVTSVKSDALLDVLRKSTARPFAPGERLFRFELLRDAPGSHILHLVSHALVIEPEALTLVLEEVASLYSAYSQDLETEETFPALQWTDYLAMGEADVVSQTRYADENYWRPLLENHPPHLELPADTPRPAVKQYTGARATHSLASGFTRRMAETADRLGAAPRDVYLASFAIYLRRLSGQTSFVLGLRSTPLYLDEAQPVVGQTRTMLPLHVRANGSESFQSFFAGISAVAGEADFHRNYSLAEMIAAARLPRDQSRSPLFAAAFSYRHESKMPSFGRLEAAQFEIPVSYARYDIELTIIDGGDGARLVCDFSTELFRRGTVERMLAGFSELLEGVLSDPETNCGDLPVMPEAEEHYLLEEMNDTWAELPLHTVLDAFLEQAAKNPRAVAVRFEDERVSYGDLRARAGQIAAQLTDFGVKRGDRVGVLLERSPDLVATLLAVWWVGAQYVPLDTAYPEKRLLHMLTDAGVACIVTRELYGNQVPADNVLIPADRGTGRISDPVDPVVQVDEGAYVIYTSGSTGLPKGVQVGHRSLMNYLLSVLDRISLSPDDTFLAITTVSFDISAMELFLPLIAGAAVDIVPDGVIADGVRLAEIMRTHRPDFMQATPSTWKMILAGGWEGDAGMVIFSGGEALDRELAEALLPRGRALWNFYGPTETTIYSTIAGLQPAPGEPVPVGKPVRNTQVYILDDRLVPVPLGAIGELYIAGAGVAMGYWGQPELTKQRFLANPFKAGGRMYRTGDLARYTADGALLCLGRIDYQVKVHGVRMELGEIESALRQVPGVSDAVVTAWVDPDASNQLVAHLVAHSHEIPTGEIRESLRRLLPEVMIPPYILFHTAFPMTENGKVRRAALPTPDTARRETPAPIPPESQVERTLAEAWGRLLRLDARSIGRDSDFMDLGGHSLLIAPLMLEVRKLFKAGFTMREFFGASTLRKLSALIEDRMERPDGASNSAPPMGPIRNEAWGRQRMAFLAREAELPPNLAPARGITYQPAESVRKLFMTGATGFLGAYLIGEILVNSDADLYCLVRPKRGEVEKNRIEQQMRHFAVWREDESWQRAWRERLHIVSGDVTLPRLGITDGQYDLLAREIDAILHSAAHVNFIYPYESLRGTNVGGVHEIIRFAFYSRIKPVHHVSTAAIWPMGSQFTFYEKDPIDHGMVLNLGYDEAKWVAEKSLLHAGERGLPVARYRPGEVGGDSVTGRCVTDHFLIASIKGFLQFGAFPELDMEVDVAPVDYVAKAITYILFNKRPYGKAFHLTNPGRVHVETALEFLRSRGYRFETMRFESLRDELLSRPSFADNAMFAYQGMLQDFDDISLQLPTYNTRETERMLKGSGIACPPADEKLFETYLAYLTRTGFLPTPEALRK